MKQKRAARKFIRVSVAANRLGYSSKTIIRRIQNEELQGYRDPKAGRTTPWLVAERDVEHLADLMKVKP